MSASLPSGQHGTARLHCPSTIECRPLGGGDRVRSTNDGRTAARGRPKNLPKENASVTTGGQADQPASLSGERYEIVAIASSAGGVTALRNLLGMLPVGFPVPIVAVQHLDRRHRTVLAQVVARKSSLLVKLAEDQEHIRPGVVYIAPPDHHLLVASRGVLTLAQSELVHFLRPSADLMFESAAASYGPRALACVLTGTGNDGAMGVSAIKSRGGTVIAEDPDTAEFAGMPRAAIETGNVDFVISLDEIAPVILGLLGVKDGQ